MSTDPLELGRITGRRPPFLPDQALMVTASQTVVPGDLEHRRPRPIPDKLRALARTFEGSDLVE